MSSVYVICWIVLQTFQTYFCIQANSMDPDQTAAKEILNNFPIQMLWSSYKCIGKQTWPCRKKVKYQRTIWVHTVCRNDFQNHKQMTKQTTIVVTGSLRVKVSTKTVPQYGEDSD